MAAKKKRSLLSYLMPILEFLIGVFGALAIIGVFFKIQDYPNFEVYMAIGFLGEAAAFVVMGIFALVGGFAEDGRAYREGDEQAVPPGAASASFRKVMDEKMSASLDPAMQSLNHEVSRFGEEMRAMSAEMQQARQSVSQMRGEMSAVGEDGFSEDAAQLGEGMRHLGAEVHAMGSEMEQSRSAVEEARAVLSNMASSRLATDAEKFEEGIRFMGDEVHAMGAEMGPARHAIQGMREELNKVVSGHLAEDAERLSGGMKQLGDEMGQAGTAVEQIRADLEHLSLRFRQFNDPVLEAGSSNGLAARQQEA